MSAPAIVDVAAVRCDLVDASWAFAADEAEAIERHWHKRRVGTPDLFDGRVLLLASGGIEPGPDGAPVFQGSCFETGFKAFMAWRDFGHPETSARNIFSMAALETSDGAFVLGEMAPHTAPAGQIYFPSGTPDRSDVAGAHVDIEGSVARELLEETGLSASDLDLPPGLILVMDRVRVCCMKRVRSAETAEALVARIHAFLAREPKPELARMHIVRSVADIVPAMPSFVVAYLRNRLAAR